MEEIFDIFDELLDDDNDIEDVEPQREPRIFHVRISMNDFTEEKFVERFHISQQSAQFILDQIAHLLERNTNQNHALTPETQLLLALRFYTSGSMVIVVADFSGIHKSTASVTIKRVSQAIASLAPQIIKVPQRLQGLNEIKTAFYNVARFPNVMGTVVCTHIRIQSPGNVTKLEQ